VQVVSINRGARQYLDHRSFQGTTGIFKRPVTGPVTIDTPGLESDAVVNTRHHGGPDQAVYLYRQEDYDWWSTELGHVIEPGAFGDNLTLAGLPEPGAVIGSQLAFGPDSGSVVLEVTAPRIPCNTLAARMGDHAFVKRFVQAERPGLYCRVVRPGSLVTGAPFTVIPYTGDPVSTLEIFRARYRRLDTAELQRFLAAPLDARTRVGYERELAGRVQTDPA